MIQPAFHRNFIGGLESIITAANVALLKRWEQAAKKKESVNLTRDISLMILKITLTSIFGADYGEVAPHFNILSEEPARTLQFAQKFRSLGKVVVQVASQRRKANAKSTDILDMLIKARDRKSGQVMSDQQLANETLTLIVAGHETTSSALNWLWYLLSKHPKVEEKLSRELSNLPAGASPKVDNLPKFVYVRRVIEEALRLYPPGWLMTRKALKDDQLGDYFVPAGTEIYIAPYFIQRHPTLWDAPDQFNPDRFDADYLPGRHRLTMLPFSAGPRNCIGEYLARIEMQIHLMTIASRLRLRYMETTPPELDAGVNLRSKHDFIMLPEDNTATDF